MLRAVAVLSSGALYAACFPPWTVAPFSFVCLIPLLWALRGLTIGRAALAGLAWGVVAIWGFGHWVPEALAHYWGQSTAFGYGLAFVGSIVFMGTYGAGFAATASLVLRSRSPWFRIAAVSVAWVAWEVARGRLLTGDPWLLLGYAWVPFPALVQVADLGSVYLVSFLAVLANTAVAEACIPGTKDRVRFLFVPFGVLLLAASYGALRLVERLPEGRDVHVRLVQANNDPGANWIPERYGQGLDDYLRLSEDDGDGSADLVIWPESSLTFFLEREPAFRSQLRDGIRRIGSQFLVGAPRIDDRDPAAPAFFNSAYLLDSEGEITGRYDKVHLLPFGEYFPLQSIRFLRRRFERVRSFTPGTDVVLLDTVAGRAATVICFEAIFPELVRERSRAGAEVIVNLSNDAWLGSDGGPRQHEWMVRMRAIENRSWVIRATTTGISSFVDPWGRIAAASPLGASSVLNGTVRPMRVDTVYERTGDVFAFGCVAATLAAVVMVVAAGRRATR